MEKKWNRRMPHLFGHISQKSTFGQIKKIWLNIFNNVYLMIFVKSNHSTVPEQKENKVIGALNAFSTMIKSELTL